MARVASLLCETLGTFTSAFALSLPYQLSPLGFSFVRSLNQALLLGLPVFTCGPWWVFCDWAAVVPLLLVTANQTTVAGLTESGVSCCLTGAETLDSKNKCTKNHCDLTVCARTVL